MANRLLKMEEELESSRLPREIEAPTALGRHRSSLIRLLDDNESTFERWVKRLSHVYPNDKSKVETNRWAKAKSLDIPLDPGAGGRSIGETALEIADVIVSTTTDFVSRGIRTATQSPISHAMLYVGDGMVVEAIGKGVVHRTLNQALASASVAVAFRYPDLTDDQRLRIRDVAGQRIGKSYDYWAIVKQASFLLDRRIHCRNLEGEELRTCVLRRERINFGTADNDSFFCSELIITAFNDAGAPLTQSLPAAISPQNLVELAGSEKIVYVGHLRTPQAVAKSHSFRFPSSASQGMGSKSLSLPDLGAWDRLINFRPPTSVQRDLKARRATVGPVTVPGTGIRLHDLDSASGPINLDYYPIQVTQLPNGFTNANDLLQYIRVNLASFLDPSIAEFEPYESADGAKFSSMAPVGAVMRFKIKAPLAPANVDDGSVVCGESGPQHFVFSTVWSPRDLGHPVSGNREWGFIQPDNGGGYVFYTRAADRATTWPEAIAGEPVVFRGAHMLWLGFQQRLAQFVTDQRGVAVIQPAISSRFSWEAVRAAYYRPSVPLD